MQADLLMVFEEKQKGIERQAGGFVKALEQEIAALKRSDTELEKLLHCEDHLHFLQAYLTLSTPMSIMNWDQIQINSRLSVEDVMRELLHLQQSVSNTTEMMSGLINLDYQKEEIKTLLKTKLQKGDTWYLVDSGWFTKWKKYVGFEIWDWICKGHETFYPGPVDNSGLLTDSLCMKENLIEELHYILLPKEAWGKLISWYGLTEHQKPIAQKVVEQGVFVKHCKAEVYLTELRLCEFSNMDQSISHHFSKTDTVACIEKEMHIIFNIPDGKETRLWRKYMHNAFECLGQPGSSIEAAGFFQGQVVVIEQRNEDGTWPRGTVRPTLPKKKL
ncbi:ubiquitin carboxyl-terminal hydrolase 15-like [Ictalurus furcatus]|uniref:ubiquitin carboxyl-terminal hydrolase 15-like n=1 Tax=Ictalurus furcatus TaxID=66913 RepID=UPI0023504280|nr:ubiquitin carboxyl-terminal hydrolase 15-like [Ictalurus furcatus]